METGSNRGLGKPRQRIGTRLGTAETPQNPPETGGYNGECVPSPVCGLRVPDVLVATKQL